MHLTFKQSKLTIFSHGQKTKEPQTFCYGSLLKKKRVIFFFFIIPEKFLTSNQYFEFWTLIIKRTCLMMCSSMKEIHSRISNPSSIAATGKNKIRHGHSQRQHRDTTTPTVLDPQELLEVLTRFCLHYGLAGTDVWKRHWTVRNAGLTTIPKLGAAKLTHAEQPVLLF